MQANPEEQTADSYTLHDCTLKGGATVESEEYSVIIDCKHFTSHLPLGSIINIFV